MNYYFKSDRINKTINNGNIAIIIFGILIFFSAILYFIDMYNPEILIFISKQNKYIRKYLILIVMYLFYFLFVNILKKRINEIVIDTNGKNLSIDFYSLLNGNKNIKLPMENINIEIKEYSVIIYDKKEKNKEIISISLKKDGFNKVTFKSIIDCLNEITKPTT